MKCLSRNYGKKRKRLDGANYKGGEKLSKEEHDKRMKQWDEATQLQCDDCKSSDFKVIESSTWWSKENPHLKVFAKHMLISCVKCGKSKKIFFPNFGWKLVTLNPE